MSQIGSLSLPDPADGTLGHYRGLVLRAGTLEEARYTGGLAVEEVVGWEKGLAMPPEVIHVEMRTPERAGGFRKKGWATHLFWELQVALPGLRAVRLIPASDTVESLLGIMARHTVGKPRPGLCAIYPTTGLVHCPMRMDMIAINNYFPAGEPQANHSNLPFQCKGVQAKWSDDMGILPSHPTVPPLHHILPGRERAREEFVATTWEIEVETQDGAREPPLKMCFPYAITHPNPGGGWKEGERIVALYAYRLRGGHWRMDCCMRAGAGVPEGQVGRLAALAVTGVRGWGDQWRST